jgi:hypothetical protein
VAHPLRFLQRVGIPNCGPLRISTSARAKDQRTPSARNSTLSQRAERMGHPRTARGTGSASEAGCVGGHVVELIYSRE